MKKQSYLSNVSDEMLVAWYKTPAFKKLQWLEQMRQIWGLALSKKKRKLLVRVV